VEYLYATRLRLAAIPEARIDQADERVDQELRAFGSRLREVLDDDLNMPLALAAVAEVLKRINDACDVAARKQGKLGRGNRAAMQQAFELIGRVLGLGLDDAYALLTRVRARRVAVLGLSEAAIEAKIEQRIQARKARDFAGADAIRDELLALGVEMMDSPGGTSWRLTR
jgi:cysteinyl-tRNA synthetase